MANWKLELTKKFDSSFEKLDIPTQKRIYEFLNVKLLSHPNPEILAKALQGPLKGLHRFRVGDYRILIRIKRNILVIIATDINHRRDVYRT
jgi:mRNA interferase RelE/StbE